MKKIVWIALLMSCFVYLGSCTNDEGEKRILRNSPKVATYDLKPEMSAYELTEALVPELQKGAVDFVCLNYANGDMVGHTGNFQAAKSAMSYLDQCLQKITKKCNCKERKE